MLLSGCSAVPEGVSGLTVDDQGRVIGAVRTCDTKMVGVEVLRVVRGQRPVSRPARPRGDLPGALRDRRQVQGRRTVKVERAELDALEPGAVLTGSTYPTAVGGSTGAQASATTTTAAPQSDASTGRDDDVVPAQEFWDTADEFCGDG
jgi:hypothetical protein